MASIFEGLLGFYAIGFGIYIYQGSTCWWFSWSSFNVIIWQLSFGCFLIFGIFVFWFLWDSLVLVMHITSYLLLSRARNFTRSFICRSSRPEVFLEMSQDSQENTCARVSFLIKLQVWGLGGVINSLSNRKNKSLTRKNESGITATFCLHHQADTSKQTGSRCPRNLQKAHGFWLCDDFRRNRIHLTMHGQVLNTQLVLNMQILHRSSKRIIKLVRLTIDL